MPLLVTMTTPGCKRKGTTVVVGVQCVGCCLRALRIRVGRQLASDGTIMHPYVLKLSFGGARNRCSAQNGQTGIQPYQSTFDDGETLQGFVRPALAEFFGSLLFVLITLLTGALLGFSLLNPQLSISFYEGATIFLLMCMFGKISGGHFNPTITISIMLCGHCRIVLGICIVFMQLFGAFIGAMLARTLCAEAAYVDAFRGSILDESDRKLINRFQVSLFLIL
ncbi:unnamed protein product [Toxocara canis]|uniref:Aquaporin-8 n=1 Tax=Toxocara canis TaxID=6265 RepID=A0A183VBF2_TOXCA|nr:unnamed protein product [Toxocara canis]